MRKACAAGGEHSFHQAARAEHRRLQGLPLNHGRALKKGSEFLIIGVKLARVGRLDERPIHLPRILHAANHALENKAAVLAPGPGPAALRLLGQGCQALSHHGGEAPGFVFVIGELRIEQACNRGLLHNHPVIALMQRIQHMRERARAVHGLPQIEPDAALAIGKVQRGSLDAAIDEVVLESVVVLEIALRACRA